MLKIPEQSAPDQRQQIGVCGYGFSDGLEGEDAGNRETRVIFGLRRAVGIGVALDLGFLEVVSFYLGTLSVLFRGDGSFTGIRANLAGGQRWELAWPPWRSSVPGLKGWEIQITHVVRARSKE